METATDNTLSCTIQETRAEQSIQAFDITYNYTTARHTAVHLVLPTNEHQGGKDDCNATCDFSESLTSVTFSVNVESLLYAFMRFLRPDQVLLSDVQTVSPGLRSDSRSIIWQIIMKTTSSSQLSILNRFQISCDDPTYSKKKIFNHTMNKQ